jgi:hypothetical protein
MIADKKKPYCIGLHFVRGTNHKWDFINACQTVQDIMTSANWIYDDNFDEIYPVPFKIGWKGNDNYYSIDKISPGVYIKVFYEHLTCNSDRYL